MLLKNGLITHAHTHTHRHTYNTTYRGSTLPKKYKIWPRDVLLCNYYAQICACYQLRLSLARIIFGITISITRAYRINQFSFAAVLQKILPAQTTCLATRVALPTVHFIQPKLRKVSSLYQMHSVMLG